MMKPGLKYNTQQGDTRYMIDEFTGELMQSSRTHPAKPFGPWRVSILNPHDVLHTLVVN